MSLLQNSNAISSGSYDINSSLRFRSAASSYLQRTPASAGNRQIWTWSCWVKKTPLASGVQAMIAAGVSTTVYDDFCFENDQIRFVFNNGTYDVKTTQVFRDPSAWYHVIVAMDTTQATASNRVKIYVNGSQVTAFATANYPAQNHNTNINNNILNNIGNLYNGSFSSYFDGYMTEVNFIDGQALTPSSFGETDSTTGVWKPKAYTGTYGTNGFYLKFSDIATTSGSNAGLGKDFSGNTNYWTTNNISVTAGTTYDAMTDVPTNTSATVANYCVFNAVNKSASALATVTNGNLNFSGGGAGYFAMVYGTIAPTSGKWYWEVTMNASGETYIGISDPKIYPDDNLPGAGRNVGFGVEDGYAYNSNGNKQRNGTATAYGTTYASGDIIGVAYDVDAGTLVFYKNNSSQGTAYTGISGGYYAPAVGGYTSNNVAINFGQRPFSYTPPTGFVRLNTYNLPDSTIKKGNTVMDATLYTGNGTTQTITNAASFRPDLVWIKGRSFADFHTLFDTVRGATQSLSSNLSNAEVTRSTALTAFTSTGFTVSSDTLVNFNANTLVAWQWQAGSSTVTNTSGSISSQVRANTTAGFSVVTYTGNGVGGATVGHGLGVAPKFIIAKTRNNVDNWPVGTSALGWNQHLLLNNTNATAVTSSTWSDTAPTSTVFTIGTDSRINSNTWTYVAYCWAEIAGFSKFGSYTGNGSTDGPFVATNFAPKFVLIKSSSDAGTDWWLMDSARSPYNIRQNLLSPNTSSAENASVPFIDFLSNGFKIRTATSGWNNNNGSTYIYACFASNPFKNSNAV